VLSLRAPGNVRMTNVPLQRSLTPGRIAQLEERGPYKAEVPGSIPGPPTNSDNELHGTLITMCPRVLK
jgi:hypothetical protein